LKFSPFFHHLKPLSYKNYALQIQDCFHDTL
jgi:hypothetical protein